MPYFSTTIKSTVFATLLWHFGGPRYAISESICIIDVDVDHYRNILDYLLGVPSIGKINPICYLGTIKPTIFAIYFDTLGVWDMQFRNQFVLSMLMWIITKPF